MKMLTRHEKECQRNWALVLRDRQTHPGGHVREGERDKVHFWHKGQLTVSDRNENILRQC